MTEGVYIPGINESKKKKKRVLFAWTALGSAFVLFIIFAVLFFRSPVFKVKEINISGNNEVEGAEILALLYAFVSSDSLVDRFMGPNNLLSWPDLLTEKELRFLPPIKKLEIEKDYSRKAIAVKILERSAVGIWCIEKENPPSCYWFDEEGVLFRSAFSSEGNLIRVVRDYAHNSMGLGNSVISKELMPNLFAILKVLEDSGLSIKEVGLYDLSLEELEVSTFSGPRILFSLRFPPEGAMDVIDSLQQKRGFNSLSYIDFRVENRAYYK